MDTYYVPKIDNNNNWSSLPSKYNSLWRLRKGNGVWLSPALHSVDPISETTTKKKTLCRFWGSNTQETKGQENTPLHATQRMPGRPALKEWLCVSKIPTSPWSSSWGNCLHTFNFLNTRIPHVPAGEICSYCTGFSLISLLILNFSGSNYVLVLE